MPPPQYQQKPLKIWALQFTGSNHQAMLDFGKDFVHLTPEDVLMQTRSPIPFEVGEWLTQWSNTSKRGEYERVPESAFNLTWIIL